MKGLQRKSDASKESQNEPNHLVNDVHSQLNACTMHDVIKVSSPADVIAAVRGAHATGRPLIAAGGRGAMGGQQLKRKGVMLDMSSYDAVHSFDRQTGRINVGAGMNWTSLYEWLEKNQSDGDAAWTFRQKQTGADFLTIGGAVSANAHGRGLNMKPFIDDVEDLLIVNPLGHLQKVSRHHNAEVFKLVCGGYGLFGVIINVTLRLKPRRVVRRKVVELDIDQLSRKFRDRIREGYEYGDFQFQIDPRSPDFLKKGVFSCYKPVDDVEIPENRKFLSPEEWQSLLYLAHVDKTKAYDLYLDHYTQSDGQLYFCDEQQMSYYLNYYHEAIDQKLGCKGSEMITELYVPRERLAEFAERVRKLLLAHSADVIYGTIRLIRHDDEAFLTWAQDDYACLILNLHINHTMIDINRNAVIFGALIDVAVDMGGSFFLTYHKWFQKEQLMKAYPKISQFIEYKKQHDPQDVFDSDWFQYITTLVES